MKLIRRQNKNTGRFSFSRISGKTKDVARASKGFFLYRKIITVLLVVTFSLLVVRVYFSNQLAVSGSFVSAYSSQVDALNKENYQLENQISQVSSLNYISSQTDRLGLVKISKVEVLSGNTGVALNQ